MRIVLETARRHGADSVRGWTGDDIRALSIYPDYREVLDAPRGAGYWAWKPLIILEELNALPDGDVLIYSDAGRADRPYRIDRPLREVVDWVLRERDGMLPGVYIPQWGANQRWTKAECFAAMGCDTPAIRLHPQIQATFSVWQAHDRSRAFVARWARWCLDPRAVADERIDPGLREADDFIDHRHDQSVLTNLALLEGLRGFGDPMHAIVGPFRHSSIDKHIGTLADRIAGRGWAIRHRLAREQLHPPGEHTGWRRAAHRLGQAVRYARAWCKTLPYRVV